MKRKIIYLVFIFLICLMVIPGVVNADEEIEDDVTVLKKEEQYKVMVYSDNIYLFSKASETSTKILNDPIPEKTILTVTSESYDYVFVKYNGKEGWIYSPNNCATMTDDDLIYHYVLEEYNLKFYVYGSLKLSREDEATGKKIETTIPRGTILTSSFRMHGWMNDGDYLYVETKDGSALVKYPFTPLPTNEKNINATMFSKVYECNEILLLEDVKMLYSEAGNKKSIINVDLKKGSKYKYKYSIYIGKAYFNCGFNTPDTYYYIESEDFKGWIYERDYKFATSSSGYYKVKNVDGEIELHETIDKNSKVIKSIPKDVTVDATIYSDYGLNKYYEITYEGIHGWYYREYDADDGLETVEHISNCVSTKDENAKEESSKIPEIDKKEKNNIKPVIAYCAVGCFAFLMIIILIVVISKKHKKKNNLSTNNQKDISNIEENTTASEENISTNEESTQIEEENHNEQ